MLASYILTPNTGTLRRVRAIDVSKNDDHIQQRELAVQYDREKYLQLLLDAAETVLAPFGFDRKLLGNGKARIKIQDSF